MKHWQYLKYVIRHKWHVFDACQRRNLFWRGLVHDLSKFRWSEWKWYAEYFYGNKRQGEGNNAISDFGCCEAAPWGYYVKDNFNLSWLKHQHRNPHHWQYWLLQNDEDGYYPLPMPKKYATEMLCDWIGAGIAITGKRDISEWYEKNKSAMRLHPDTYAWIEHEIACLMGEDG